MRYRKLSSTGDSTFGSGNTQFLINTPDAVAQAVLTRLLLLTDEWFLDTSEGTPYSSEILGKYTASTFDFAIQSRINGTQGVQSIESYSSTVDTEARALTVNATINTIYGQTTIQASL